MSNQISVSREPNEPLKKKYKLPNPNQRAFCENYVKSLKVSESYEAAYPDSKSTSALASGHRLLAQDFIKHYINGLVEEAFNLIGDPKELKAALIRGAIDIALNDEEYATARLTAMKMIGQGMGLFIEKSEITSRDIIVGRELNEDEEDEDK